MPGDDEMIQQKIDTISIMIEVRDSDHVKTDGMYQVDENEML